MDSSQEFAARYASMSEVELMDIAQEYDSLTDAAQAALRAEFAKRKMEPPRVREPVEFDLRSLVTVRRYRDLSEAIVARSLLEAEGIEAWIQDENLVRLDWAYSNLVGGIRLQVDAQDEQVAREVLARPVPPTIAFEEGAEFEQPKCPRCGSLEVTFLGSDRRAALASVTLLSVPLPLGRESWQCETCGAHWEETDEEGSSGEAG